MRKPFGIDAIVPYGEPDFGAARPCHPDLPRRMSRKATLSRRGRPRRPAARQGEHDSDAAGRKRHETPFPIPIPRSARTRRAARRRRGFFRRRVGAPPPLTYSRGPRHGIAPLAGCRAPRKRGPASPRPNCTTTRPGPQGNHAPLDMSAGCLHDRTSDASQPPSRS